VKCVLFIHFYWGLHVGLTELVTYWYSGISSLSLAYEVC